MMTTGILDSLMRLFAVFAAGRSPREAMLGRQSANRYLSGRLSRSLTEDYLKRYDLALRELNKGMEPSFDEIVLAKRTSKLSVKLLRICSRIQVELEMKDRLVMFLRLAEFARTSGTIDNGDSFLQGVADALHLPPLDALNIKALVKAEKNEIPNEMCQYFSMGFGHGDVSNELIGCRISLDDIFFIKYMGEEEVRLNGQLLPQLTCATMAQGSVLKDNSGHAIFFSDILRSCAKNSSNQIPVSFVAKDVAHFFSYPNEQALRPINLRAEQGELIGIMGASGSGKSTLLNILNGSETPSFGQVLLNGKSVYNSPESAAGCIGHIAQEDVLISELTVRENLRYSAALSLGHLDDQKIDEQVDDILKRIGLWDIRSLRVGSLMEKTISGGQRKRVNIALELIREPLVLFVDEPTSGLSSRDSEQIMDLLKELSLRGKLIFVV
ncbi:MAG TPA: ABC transporter, partial [Opitutae bacterium]|nr:ABC transporter [Opitutae bacterium]